MAKLFRLAVASIDRRNCVAGCLEAIAQAGRASVDLLVLPEEPDVISHESPYEHTIEQHPLFREFQKAARDAGVAVVSSLSAKVEGGVANMGFVLGREGELIGLYSKKHPAPSEEAIVDAPVVGDPFPVFDLYGTKVAISICMDIHFPEMYRIYGLKGADIVCLPTMYLDYTGDMLESLEKARSIDNGFYLAVSHYIEKPFLAGKSIGYSKIVAPDGRVIASTGHEIGLSIAEIDPKWRFPFWATEEPLKSRYPDLRVMFEKIRRPELYGPLVEPNSDRDSEIPA